MAKIPLTNRQVMESPASLPAATGPGRLAEALGGISNMAGQIGTNLRVEEATLQGAKEREQGGPKKLAPGVNKATQAYNNAFLEMDAALVYQSATESMALDMIEASRPENLMKGNASAKFLELSKSRINGALSQAMPQTQAQLGFKLNQSAHNQAIRLAEMQVDFDFKQSRANAAVVLKQGFDQFQEAMRGGYFDIAKEHETDLRNNLAAQTQLGYITPIEKYEYEQNLDQAALNGAVEHEYLAAFNRSEDEAAQYVNNFYNSKNPKVTQAQKEGALQHLLGVHTRLNQSMTQVSQIGFDNVMRGILPFEGTGFTSIDQVRDSVQQQIQNGHPINLHQQFQLEAAFLKKLKTNNSRALKNAEITQKMGSSEIAFTPKKDISNWFVDAYTASKKIRDDNVMSATTPGQRVMANVPDWMLAASIASHMQYSEIPAYTNLLHTQLMNGSIDERINAITAFNFLETNNPVAVKGFSARDTAFVHDVLSGFKNTTRPREEIIQNAIDTILKVDEKEYENRNKELGIFLKDNPKTIGRLTKEIFGENLTEDLVGPGSVMYAATQREFERNWNLLGNGEKARRETVKNMEGMAGESIFSKKGLPMFNPPERLPFYTFGNIVGNQYAQALKEIANNAEKFSDTLPDNLKIKWSSKMNEVPNVLSDTEKFTGKYYKDKAWLNIGGVDRQVYLVSPTYNQATAIGGTQYQFYYDDNGVPKPLRIVSVQQDQNGNPVPRLSNGIMQFKSPDLYIPGLLQQMNDNMADANVMKHAEAAFNSVTPNDFNYELYPPIGRLGAPTSPRFQKPSKVKEQEFKQFLESFKTELPDRIEQERLQRQLQQAENQL